MKAKQLLWIFFITTLASRCLAINDPVGYGNYNVANVQVVITNPSTGLPETKSVPVSQYVKGVLFAEIHSWSDATHQEAFTAQAIAILTFLQNYNNNNIDPSTNLPFPIPGDTSEQAYDDTYDGSDPIIEQAYALAGTTVLNYPDPNWFTALYFGSTGSYTIPSEKNGNYLGYLRISPNTEPTDLNPPAAPGHGIGMSQAGAFYLSELGQTASNILLHYYHSSPPIARSISVYQGGSIEGDQPNNSHDTTTEISGGTLIYTASWADAGATRTFSNPTSLVANGAVSMQFEIIFSEQVNFGSIAVTLVSASNTQGVAIQDSIVSFWGNSLGTGKQPTYWFGEIEPDDLASLGSGPVTIQISAVHQYVAGGVLDSNPADVAFYFDGNPNYALNDPGAYQPGPDVKNIFQLGNTVYVQSVALSQGPQFNIFYTASWPITAQGAPPSGPLSVATNIPLDNHIEGSLGVTLGFR
jgi:hypothetical protein